MSRKPSKKKLVIHRIGSLGDTVVSLPSFVAIREANRDYDIILLCNDDKKGSLRFYNQLVIATGLANKLVSYESSKGSFYRLVSFLRALLKVRLDGCNILYYLMPSERSLKSERRDYIIFKIFRFVAIKGIRKNGEEKNKCESEVKQLLKRTELHLNMSREDVFKVLTHSLSQSENLLIEKIFNSVKSNGSLLYGIAPGAAKANHLWPSKNFLALVKILYQRYGAKPVVFGGPAERDMFKEIAAEIDDIHFINHTFSIQMQVLMMERCKFFISNDTGSIHLANVAGPPIIGIYPHPELGGPWLPAWGNSVIVRKEDKCLDCLGSQCQSSHPCINGVTVKEVLASVERVITDISN